MSDFNVDIANELLRLQQQKGRRAMALDAAYELIRASAGAAYSERYGLVTQKVVEEVARHLPDVTASTEEELRRLTPALADFMALLSTMTVVASYLAEEVAGHNGTRVDETTSVMLTRVATQRRRSVS
jgi:hypothetical protein